uniref:Hemicentin-1-like n=1 Tax=Saccoglossus kowalevskii TaxID=10224 RepID=A0ABM0MA02_SACKO|nr:PREDICTED: hemicentin-1-like [Saccoglossus kowalevskii]
MCTILNEEIAILYFNMIVHITLIVFVALWSEVHGIEWKDIPDAEVYTQLGSSVTLQCAFDVTPTLSTKWSQESPTYRDVSFNTAIVPGSCDECSISGDSSNAEFYLTINPIKADHIGTWRCKILELVPQYYETDIIMQEPATIITPPSDQTVNEDGSVTFECTATGVPDVTYTWQKDSTDIDIGGRYAVTDGSLTISNIEKSDYGTYTCIADNGVGSGDSRSSVLTVNFKPESSSLSGYTGAVTSGSNLLLTCTTTTSNPSATILWYRNNNIIYDNDDNINIGSLIETNGDYNGKISEQQITITTRAEDNQAEYKCKARNSQVTGDVYSNSVPITVYFKPDSASLSGYTGSVTSRSYILLTCTTTTSNPSATILWYRNNKIDDNDDNINIGILTETNGDYNGKISEQQITITTRAEDNQAEYKCKARNPQITGDVNSYIETITVYFSPVYPDGCSTLLSGYPGDNGHVIAGDILILTCTSCSSNPDASLIWYHDNQMINVPNQLVYVDSVYSGRKSTQEMTITLTYRHHNNELYCKAKNSQVGQSKQSNAVFLNVHYKPFVVNVSNNQWSVASQGTVAELRCEIESNPLSTVIWYRPNNQSIHIDSRTSIKTVSHGTLHESILTIQNTMLIDYGSYSCFAENDIGNTTFIVTFNDNSVPDAPKSIVPLYRYYDRLSVIIIPGYNGGDINTTYFIQYRTRKNASFIELNTGSSDISITMQIRKLESSTPYECRAYAANAIGIGPYSNSIVIRTLDEPIVELDYDTRILSWTRHENKTYTCVKIETRHVDVTWDVIVKCIDRNKLEYKVNDTNREYRITYCTEDGICESREFSALTESISNGNIFQFN